MRLSEKKPVTQAHRVYGSHLYEMSRISRSKDTEVDEWLPVAAGGGGREGGREGGVAIKGQHEDPGEGKDCSVSHCGCGDKICARDKVKLIRIRLTK